METTVKSENLFNGLFQLRSLKLIALGSFALAVLAVSLIYFALILGKPYMGITLSVSDQGWSVQSVDPNGLAVQAGIQKGDTPTEINGQPAEIFLGKYEQSGTVMGFRIQELTVEGENGLVKHADRESRFPSWQSIAEWASWFFVSLIFWTTGLYAFLKRPRNPAAVLLFLCSLILGLALSTQLAGSRAILGAPELAIVFSVIGPWLLLHFFLVLPEERSWLSHNKAAYLIYLPAIVTLLLFPIWGYTDGQPVQWFRTIRILEMGVAFLAIIGVGIFNYFNSASPQTRQQMRIVLISCLIAVVPFLILSIFPATLWKQPTIPSGFNIVFLSAIPIGMAYAVLTTKLMDIDIVIRRGIIYTLITLIMAAVVSGGIFLVISLDQTLGITGKILVALVLGGIATALFGPTKKWIEFLVDKLFFKDRYDYSQIIHSLHTSLNTLDDSTEIARLVVGMIVQTLNLAGACLFIKSPSGDYVAGAAQGSFADRNKQNQLLGLISRKDHGRQFPKTASSSDSEVSYVVPLLQGDNEVGALCLSHKASRQEFLSSDIFLLQDLASVAATALRGAMLSQDVSSRDVVISITSHELRTPLTAINIYADLLLRGNEREDMRKKWLKNIIHNNQVINSVVEDLINVTRLQSGKVPLKTETFNLSDILRDRVNFARDSSSKHQFIVDIEFNLPNVLVDRHKISQVLSNLLTNAIKYSPKGGTISILARRDPLRQLVVVSITDQGIGIAQPDRESLFTLFHRIKRPETQGIEGTGLGLYIAKKFVQAMGGEIWVESELNRGSTFYVAVPVCQTPSA
jgi:signal transduction histidine kinase